MKFASFEAFVEAVRPYPGESALAWKYADGVHADLQAPRQAKVGVQQAAATRCFGHRRLRRWVSPFHYLLGSCAQVWYAIAQCVLCYRLAPGRHDGVKIERAPKARTGQADCWHHVRALAFVCSICL